MISRSIGTAAPTILDIAPYAGFGAFYFLLSAIWLVAAANRNARLKYPKNPSRFSKDYSSNAKGPIK